MKKRLYKQGEEELYPTIQTEGGTVTKTTVLVGGYEQLAVRQQDLARGAKSTELKATEGGMGELTVTEEGDAGEPNQPKKVELEVDWVELQLPIETHQIFQDLSVAQVKEVKEQVDAEGGKEKASWDEKQKVLFGKLVRGQTVYSVGVPVVRRTTTNQYENLSTGRVWVRDTPPVSIQGYEFLKTADKRTKSGKTYSRVEEWTGGEKIDRDIYPD